MTDPVFESVVCVVGRDGHAAREQAAALAGGGDVEYVEAPRRTPVAARALLERCDGADLLVLGTGELEAGVMRRASMPVLLPRWCPSGARVTDRILVAVDDESEPDRAAQAAGRLASRYRGEVAVVSAPALDRTLERATEAASRIVLAAAGNVPGVHGRRLPPERAILSAAASFEATLLVLPVGKSEQARRRAVSIARLVPCSVLAIPVPTAAPRGRRAATDVDHDVPALL